MGQDADVGTCQRQTAKSQLRWSNEPGDLGGCDLNDCEQAAAPHVRFIWAFPTPLGWASEQSEVQAACPAEHPALPLGGKEELIREHRQQRDSGGRMEQARLS